MDEPQEPEASEPSVTDALTRVAHDMMTSPADKGKEQWSEQPNTDSEAETSFECEDCHTKFKHAMRISNVIRCAACWEKRIESIKKAAAALSPGFRLNI